MKGNHDMNLRQRLWPRMIAGAGLAVTLALTGCDVIGSTPSATEQPQSSERTDAWVMTKKTWTRKDNYHLYDTSGTLESKSDKTFTVDERGNVVTEYKEFLSNAPLFGFCDQTTTTRTFDEDGYVQTESITVKDAAYDEAWPDTLHTHGKTYTYEKDDTGRVTKSTCANSEDQSIVVTTYEYDTDGRLAKQTETKTREVDGTQQSFENTVTDYEDGLAKRVTTTTDVRDTPSTVTYSYIRDSKRRVARKTTAYDNGTFRDTRYTWDENDNIATEQTTFEYETGTIVESATYEWIHVDRPSKCALDHYKEVCMLG